jgi:hypothetical protein
VPDQGLPNDTATETCPFRPQTKVCFFMNQKKALVDQAYVAKNVHRGHHAAAIYHVHFGGRRHRSFFGGNTKALNEFRPIRPLKVESFFLNRVTR